MNAIDLSNSVQNVGTFAAKTSASGAQIAIVNSSALTIGSVDTLNGVTTNNGNIGLKANSGDLTLQQNVSAGTGIVGLSAASGSVLAAAGAVSADKVAALALNSVDLTNSANSFNTLAASASGNNGTVSVNDSKSVIIGTVTGFNNTFNGISTGSNGSVNVTAAGSIAVNQAVNSSGGSVTLDASAAGPVSGTGVISSGSLLVKSSSGIALTGDNVVSNVDLQNSGSNGVNYRSNIGSGNTMNIKGQNGSGNFIVNEVSGNLNVGPSSIDTIATSGGVVNLTAQAGTLSISGGILTNSSFTAGADIVLQADRMALQNAISGVNAGTSGKVVLKPYTLASTPIYLGLSGDLSAGLELSSAELNVITANGIQIGDVAGSDINIQGNLSSSSTGTLSLQTGGAINASSGTGVTVANLNLMAGSGVNMGLGSNQADTLSAQVTGSGGVFNFQNTKSLTIGTVAGVSGINTNSGAIDVNVQSGDLTVAQNVNGKSAAVTLETNSDNSLLTVNSGVTVNSDLGVSNGGSLAVHLRGDRIDLQGSARAQSGVVVLSSASAGRNVTLGTDDVNAATASGGSMGLTQAELDRVTAVHIGIGTGNQSARGNIAIAAPISITRASHLVLAANNGITQARGATVSVGELTLQSTGSVMMLENNQVNSLAASVGGLFAFNTLGALSIDTLPGAGNISGPNSNIALISGISASSVYVTAANTLTVNAPVSSSSSVTLISDSDMTLNNTVTSLAPPESISISNSRGIWLETKTGLFTNNVGGSVLSSNTGWWIWAVSPGTTFLNGLTPDFTRYDANSSDSAYVSSLPASGNGVLYQSNSTGTTTDSAAPTTETTVTKSAADSAATAAASGNNFPNQGNDGPPPKLVVDATKIVPRAAGVLDMSELAALSQKAHDARTQLFSDALDVLADDPNAADVPTCDETNKDVCIISTKVAQGGKAQVTAQEFLAPVIKRKVALLIGNNLYKSPIPELETAVGDVTAIANELRDRFGYEVTIVQNADRKTTIDALNNLIKNTEQDDSVLVMYAGHGYLDEKKGNGYWIPTDGGNSNPNKWISNAAIAKALSNIPAKQVMLVSDSCYSGSLTKEGKLAANAKVNRDNALTRRSVLAMSSGGEEPVSDEGFENHSIFAWSMIQALRNATAETSGQELHAIIKNAVTKEFPQVPQYGVVVSAGHREGGEFLFLPKN